VIEDVIKLLLATDDLDVQLYGGGRYAVELENSRLTVWDWPYGCRLADNRGISVHAKGKLVKQLHKHLDKIHKKNQVKQEQALADRVAVFLRQRLPFKEQVAALAARDYTKD
jgi:hypothetical protein